MPERNAVRVGAVLSSWCDDCNHVRPHGGIGGLSPPDDAGRVVQPHPYGHDNNPDSSYDWGRNGEHATRGAVCDPVTHKIKPPSLSGAAAEFLPGEFASSKSRRSMGQISSGEDLCCPNHNRPKSLILVVRVRNSFWIVLGTSLAFCIVTEACTVRAIVSFCAVVKRVRHATLHFMIIYVISPLKALLQCC
jgi:type III secretory pathway component EscS